MNYEIVILLAAILFLVIILSLAAKPRITPRIISGAIIFAALGGFFFYGYGFAATKPQTPLAALRTLLAVCGMFVGKNEYSAISTAPILQTGSMQFLFWLIHLAALYATASAAIASIGAGALRELPLYG